MPPNSFAEWVIGSNAATRRRSRAQRRVLANLEVSTDDETGNDTVSLTLPRDRKLKGKQVRFAAPEKSSVKGSSEEVSTDTNTSGDGATTDEGGDEFDSDCLCGKCMSNRQRLKKVKQLRKKSESSADEAEADAEIHAKNTAKKMKGNKSKDKKKISSDSGITIDSNDNASTDDEKQKSKSDKKKVKKDDNDKCNGERQLKSRDERDDKNRKNSDDGSESTSDTTGPEKSEDLPKVKGKKKQNAEDGTAGGKDTQKTKSKGGKKKSSGDATHYPVPGQKYNQKGKLLPYHQSPDIRTPNLIMPIHAQVIQIEHAVETMEDPRPNAFYDIEHGIMRVYHGPSYSNPYGALYPKRVYNNQPLPVGTPHPAQNPWYSSFPRGNGTIPSLIPPAPQPKGTQSNNPWFQGWGATNTPGVPSSPKPRRIVDPNNPFFGAEIDIPTSQNPQNPFDLSPSTRSSKTKKDREAGLNSNVVPLGTPPSKPRTSADSNLWWDTQSAPGNIRKAASSKRSKGKERHTFGNEGSGDICGKPYTSDDSKDVDNFLQSQRRSTGKDGSQNSGNNGGWITNNDKSKSNEVDLNDSAIGDSNNNGGGEWGANTGNDSSNINNGCWGTISNENQNSGPDWGTGNINQNNSGGLNGNIDNNTNWGAKNDTNQVDVGWRSNNNENDQNNGASWGNSNSNNDEGSGNHWGNSNEQNVNTSGKNDGNGSQTSKRSRRSTINNAAPPGAWPVDGGNVIGDGDWNGSAENAAGPNTTQGSSPYKPPSTAGNVACHGEWGDPTAAQSTGGYWEKEGKGEEGKVQKPMW